VNGKGSPTNAWMLPHSVSPAAAAALVHERALTLDELLLPLVELAGSVLGSRRLIDYGVGVGVSSYPKLGGVILSSAGTTVTMGGVPVVFLIDGETSVSSSTSVAFDVAPPYEVGVIHGVSVGSRAFTL